MRINDKSNMSETHNKRTALVAYGSETGNAQELAEELGRVTRRLHFIPRVVDLDSLNVVCECASFLLLSLLLDKAC